jgi:hypothetical protein
MMGSVFGESGRGKHLSLLYHFPWCGALVYFCTLSPRWVVEKKIALGARFLKYVRTQTAEKLHSVAGLVAWRAAAHIFGRTLPFSLSFRSLSQYFVLMLLLLYIGERSETSACLAQWKKMCAGVEN